MDPWTLNFGRIVALNALGTIIEQLKNKFLEYFFSISTASLECQYFKPIQVGGIGRIRKR